MCNFDWSLSESLGCLFGSRARAKNFARHWKDSDPLKLETCQTTMIAVAVALQDSSETK